MRCQFCGHTESKVLDSRSFDDSNSIRRRRECLNCGKRFTTFETIETTPILVIKNDGSRQQYDKNKLKRGIIRACEKRPVTMAQIDALVDKVEKVLYSNLDQEVSTKKIGELVMEGLKDIDDVSYVRFASVYRQFTDIDHFSKFIKSFKNN